MSDDRKAADAPPGMRGGMIAELEGVHPFDLSLDALSHSKQIT